MFVYMLIGYTIQIQKYQEALFEQQADSLTLHGFISFLKEQVQKTQNMGYQYATIGLSRLANRVVNHDIRA